MRTTSAASTATSVPEAIAIPTSAYTKKKPFKNVTIQIIEFTSLFVFYLSQSWRIVDTITNHSHFFALLLKHPDFGNFVRRQDFSIDCGDTHLKKINK